VKYLLKDNTQLHVIFSSTDNYI